MGYWYVPSTYRGRKYGRGIKGYGRFVGGSFSGGVAFMDSSPVETPVEEAIAETADPVDQEKIAEAEATGKPVTVKKSTFNLWNGMKGLASGTWNLAKKAYANPLINAGLKMGATYLAEQYGPGLAMGALRGAYKGYLKGSKAFNEGLDALAYNRMKNRAPEFTGRILNDESIPASDKTNAAKVMINQAIKYGSNTLGERLKRGLNRLNQWGTQALIKGNNAYRNWRGIKGSGRFRKGSPEARAYMAMLRARRGMGARRRTRLGRGIIGGWWKKGVSPELLNRALNDQAQENNDRIRILDWDKVNYIQENGEDLYIDRDEANRMMDNWEHMNEFWLTHNYDDNGNLIDGVNNNYEEKMKFKKRYIAENRLKGRRYRHPTSAMSNKRFKRLQKQLARSYPYTLAYWSKRLKEQRKTNRPGNIIDKYLISEGKRAVGARYTYGRNNREFRDYVQPRATKLAKRIIRMQQDEGGDKWFKNRRRIAKNAISRTKVLIKSALANRDALSDSQVRKLERLLDYVDRAKIELDTYTPDNYESKNFTKGYLALRKMRRKIKEIYDPDQVV